MALRQKVHTYVVPTPTQAKLIGEQVVGIQSHKVGEEDIFEIVGWVKRADPGKQEIELSQKGDSFKIIKLSLNTKIRQALVDGNGKLELLPKAFDDLVPEKVRVNILCSNSNCLEAEAVTIIEIKAL